MKGEKTGGRAKGTPNRLTKELRSVLKDVIHKELEQLPQHFEQLDNKERIELLVKLLPYAMPKIVSVTANANEPLDWGI